MVNLVLHFNFLLISSLLHLLKRDQVVLTKMLMKKWFTMQPLHFLHNKLSRQSLHGRKMRNQHLNCRIRNRVGLSDRVVPQSHSNSTTVMFAKSVAQVPRYAVYVHFFFQYYGSVRPQPRTQQLHYCDVCKISCGGPQVCPICVCNKKFRLSEKPVSFFACTSRALILLY